MKTLKEALDFVDSLYGSLDAERGGNHLFNYMQLYGSQADRKYFQEIIDTIVKNEICKAGYEARK